MKSVRPLLALMAGTATLAAVVTPAIAAESRVMPDQLHANQTVTISNIPTDHQADSLKLYRIADYTAATVDGSTLTAYDMHATRDSAVLQPSSNDTDQAKPGDTASADEQLAYILEHYQSANNADDNYGLYTSLLRDSVGAYSGNNPSVAGLPSYPVTFTGTSGSVSVPAGIYVMTDTATSGVQCQASLLATGVGGATSIGDTTLGQTTCKHVTPDAPVKNVLDADDNNKPKNLAHVATGDTVTWQISAKAGWDDYFILQDTLPAGFSYHNLTSVTSSKTGALKAGDYAINAQGNNVRFVLRLDKSAPAPVFGTNPAVTTTNANPQGADRTVGVGETVTVTFTTTVTDPSTTVIDGNGNINHVTRLWNRNDSSKCVASVLNTGVSAYPECSDIPGNNATVKTHEITLKKTDMTGNVLNGAHFTLTRNGKGVEVKNGYVSGYGTASDLTVNNTLNIKGLDTGDYVLKETTAPAGYTGVGLPTVTFTMNDDGTITEKSGDLFELVSANKNTVTVKNAKNLTQLPMTGMGGVIVAVSAAGIFILLGLAIETRVRKHA